MGIWDDHDFGINNGGRGYVDKHASQQLFLDFLGEPASSPRREQYGVYTSQVFDGVASDEGEDAPVVQIILLVRRMGRAVKRRPSYTMTHVDACRTTDSCESLEALRSRIRTPCWAPCSGSGWSAKFRPVLRMCCSLGLEYRCAWHAAYLLCCSQRVAQEGHLR